jgi:predicted RNase H-like HicB family nuclease
MKASALRFLVMIRPTATGSSADVPDLPGCVAAAGTVKGIRKLIAGAIEMHLELMQQSGGAIPAPRERLEFVIDPEAGQELCTWVEVAAP